MNKQLEKLIDKLNKSEFTVKGYEDYVSFQIYSPLGQNINVELQASTVEELKAELFNYLDDFDTSYETYLWLDDEGHGKNGAPYDMRDLYNDMEWCWKQLDKLYDDTFLA